ncbi:PepSY domain-containing protein [Desulfocurvibacter africanus]|uniref:PepSY domain-containing protein n=1 Tax=Desulfocurvibacter africanus TaxID=873 RepID=UPI000427E606
MHGASLRKWHRKLGILLVFFLALQALTGLILSASHMMQGEHAHAQDSGSSRPLSAAYKSASAASVSSDLRFENSLAAIHHGGGPAGDVYRLVLGIATLAQGGMGVMLYFGQRHRHAS